MVVPTMGVACGVFFRVTCSRGGREVPKECFTARCGCYTALIVAGECMCSKISIRVRVAGTEVDGAHGCGFEEDIV